jgi:hypothetical protein
MGSPRELKKSPRFLHSDARDSRPIASLDKEGNVVLWRLETRLLAKECSQLRRRNSVVFSSPDVTVLAVATSHASTWLCTIRRRAVFLESRSIDSPTRSDCKLVQLGDAAGNELPTNVVESIITCHRENGTSGTNDTNNTNNTNNTNASVRGDAAVAVVVVVVISTLTKVTVRAWRMSAEEGRDELLPASAVMEMEGVLQADSVVLSPVGREAHQKN